MIQRLYNGALYFLETPLDHTLLNGHPLPGDYNESVEKAKDIVRSMERLKAPNKKVVFLRGCLNVIMNQEEQTKLILDYIYSSGSSNALYLQGIVLEAEKRSEANLKEAGKNYEQAVMHLKEGAEGLARHLLLAFQRLNTSFDTSIQTRDLVRYHPSAAVLFGAMRLREGSFDEALYHLTGAERSSLPISRRIKIDLLSALGEAHYSKGSLHYALDSYRKILEIDPDNLNARHQLETLESRCS